MPEWSILLYYLISITSTLGWALVLNTKSVFAIGMLGVIFENLTV